MAREDVDSRNTGALTPKDAPAGKYKIEDTFAAMRSKMAELEEEIRLKCAHDADYIHELEGERDHYRNEATALLDRGWSVTP